jgi:Tfp pilus assembly protein PilX
MIKVTMQALWRNFLSAHAQAKRENGQILIIILLVLVVGVSIVLSLSARSLTDIRTTTSTEQSNRAYFAAEAGIERALQQIKDGGISDTTLIQGNNNPLGSGNAQYNGQIELTGGTANAFGYDALKDQSVQVNLKPNINMATYTDSSFGLSSGTLTVYWHTSSDGNPGDESKMALEISVLRVNATGAYTMDKYGCDPDTTRQPVNGLNCSGGTGPLQTFASCDSNIDVDNKAQDTDFCYGFTFNATAANHKSILMRIRPICPPNSGTPACTSISEPIAVRYNGGNLPQQGYKITSTGTGQDGATRKLVVFRSFPTLPTVFDFVLYNGSNNALTKP